MSGPDSDPPPPPRAKNLLDGMFDLFGFQSQSKKQKTNDDTRPNLTKALGNTKLTPFMACISDQVSGAKKSSDSVAGHAGRERLALCEVAKGFMLKHNILNPKSNTPNPLLVKTAADITNFITESLKIARVHAQVKYGDTYLGGGEIKEAVGLQVCLAPGFPDVILTRDNPMVGPINELVGKLSTPDGTKKKAQHEQNLKIYLEAAYNFELSISTVRVDPDLSSRYVMSPGAGEAIAKRLSNISRTHVTSDLMEALHSMDMDMTEISQTYAHLHTMTYTYIMSLALTTTAVLSHDASDQEHFHKMCKKLFMRLNTSAVNMCHSSRTCQLVLEFQRLTGMRMDNLPTDGRRREAIMARVAYTILSLVSQLWFSNSEGEPIGARFRALCLWQIVNATRPSTITDYEVKKAASSTIFNSLQDFQSTSQMVPMAFINQTSINSSLKDQKALKRADLDHPYILDQSAAPMFTFLSAMATVAHCVWEPQASREVRERKIKEVSYDTLALMIKKWAGEPTIQSRPERFISNHDFIPPNAFSGELDAAILRTCLGNIDDSVNLVDASMWRKKIAAVFNQIGIDVVADLDQHKERLKAMKLKKEQAKLAGAGAGAAP